MNNDLVEKTESIAKETHGPNKQVVHSIANQIRSNNNLIEVLEKFANSTRKTELVMICLTIAQIVLAVTLWLK